MAPATAVPGVGRPCLVFISGARLGEIIAVDRAITIGRDRGNEVRVVDDEGISRRHLRLEPRPDGVYLEDLQSQNGVLVGDRHVRQCRLEDGDKIRIGQNTVLRFAVYDPLEEQAQRTLFEGALRDTLTRAFNRRYFLPRLIAEIRFAQRHKQSVGLLLIDIDHLKQLNDEHGHLAGDEAIRQIATHIQSRLRAEDVMARWGGDELIVLMRAIPLIGCMRLAERLRETVDGALFSHDGHTTHLTISVGVATFSWQDPPGDEPPEQALIRRADLALGESKNAGRNRVTAAAEPSPPATDR